MGTRKQILVVDDDEQILFVWRGALARYADRWCVKTARNGGDALDLVTQTPFDLIVTDIKMPGMNGCELTSAVRRLDEKVAVLWITCFPDADLHEKADRLDVRDCLIKPLSITQIRKVVAEALVR
ncbi:MAG: response regulator [Anaerolineae bacterium]